MIAIKNWSIEALFIFYFILLISCNGNKNTSIKDSFSIAPPPPPPPDMTADVYCDSLRARTYADLRKGESKLVTDNFPQGNVNKTMLFEEILNSKYHLKLLPIYDSVYYPRCIMPIMDSVIEARYGQEGKAMIIEQVNKLTDSIFKKVHDR